MPLLPVSELERLALVFRGKAGNAFGEFLRRILGVKTLSDLNDRISDKKGPDFAGALLEELGIDYRLGGSDKLRNLPEGAFITVSNHPYGSMDGIILVDLIGHLRPDFKVMVNEFLDMIESLRPTWIAVNPKNASAPPSTACSQTSFPPIGMKPNVVGAMKPSTASTM